MAVANTTIRIKKSLVSGNVPLALANGELAINAADDKLYFAKPSGTISYITNQQTFATINANSSLILATSSTDTLTLVPGNNITITACTSTKTITVDTTSTLNVSNIIVPTLYTTVGGIVFPDGTRQITTSSGAAIDQFARGTANSRVFNYRQNTAPSTANNSGDFWTNTDTGVVYENFGNTSNPVWAETGPTGITGNTAPGLLAGTQANISGQLFVTYTPPTTSGAAIQVTAANTIGGTGYADFIKFTNTSGGATYPNKTIRMNNLGSIEIIDSNYGNNIFNLSDSGDLTIKGNFITANRPAFRVYGANTTSISATNTLTYSNFAVDYNQGGYLNISTGVFTAPIAGLYQVNLIARFSGSASIAAIQVQKTSGVTVSTQVYIEWAGNSTAYHMGGSSVVKMAAGDTLKTVVTSGTVTFDANDCWSVVYLG